MMRKDREIIAQTPEVRPERVAALRQALQQGTYRINPRKLANILILKLLCAR